MEAIYKLTGVMQHYAWGGTEFIPQLLATTNDENKPAAEYWLGAHPNAPSLLPEENRMDLQSFVGQHTALVLGVQTAKKFGSLPYLFKVLDVRQMLSIQVHPSKAAAVAAFAEENKMGIALTAPDRNYKDENHKPELMVALGDFWLLHGFKERQALYQMFEKVPVLSFLKPLFEEGGYKKMYEAVMTIPQEEVNKIISSIAATVVDDYNRGKLSKDDENFWCARAIETFCKDGTFDRGIFSIYLFNLVHLKKGEAIYQAAGLPHAYLEGQNIEIMANSDNVLRAGLTNKHIDVPELMKHVKFESTTPAVIANTGAAEQSFTSPAEEFLLKKYEGSQPFEVREASATILFVYDGKANIRSGSKTLSTSKGEAIFIIAESQVFVEPFTPGVTIFTAVVPGDKNW